MTQGTNNSYRMCHRVPTIYISCFLVPASLISPRQDGAVVSVPVGGSVELRCEANGIPTPTVSLLKDVYDISWHNLDSYNGTAVRKIKRIDEVTPSHAGTYVCLAYNVLVGPPEGKRRITDWKTIILEVNGMKIRASFFETSVYSSSSST